MPRSKSTQESKTRRAAPPAMEAEAPQAGAREKADALFRAATECCRQHERYARVVNAECEDGEEQAASRQVGICDEHLRSAVESYERAAVRPDNGTGDEWWRRANALWLASREWVRRHELCDESSRRLTRHDPKKLGQLAVEYDLEASALLALQHAIDAYRKVAPHAELNGKIGH